MIIDLLIDFVLMFIVIFLVYLFFINRKKIKYEQLKETDFIKIFIRRYNINVEKVNYNFLINTLALINSFIIAFTSTVILKIESFIWSVIVAFVVLFLLVYSLFELAGRYFKNLEGKVKTKKVKTKKRKKLKKKEDEK